MDELVKELRHEIEILNKQVEELQQELSRYKNRGAGKKKIQISKYIYLEMVSDGKPVKEIAAYFGISLKTLYRRINEWIAEEQENSTCLADINKKYGVTNRITKNKNRDNNNKD